MSGATTADVVVVGGGAAGLAAASEAQRAGAQVILLEKNPALGGSMAWSVGSISASRTPHQRRAGIEDSPQAHFEDLELLAGRYAPRDNIALRRILADSMPETFDWLLSVGLEFVGPNIEPPHRVSRMHNVLPNSRAFPYHLGRYCRKLGVDIRLHTAVEDLIVTDGAVTGVIARSADGTAHGIAARNAVILAAGDYSGSKALKAQFAAADVVEVDPVNPTATGDGFTIGLAHGAVMVNGDIVRGPIMRFIPPRRRKLLQALPPVRPLTRFMRWSFDHLPAALLRPFVMSFLTTAVSPSMELFREGAILINQDGQRFGDELDRPGHATARQRDRLAYLLLDHTVAQKFSAWPNYVSTAPGVAYAYLPDYRRSRADIYHQAGTIEALARQLGMPPATLAATVSAYNAGADGIARGGVRQPIAQPPYTALGPIRSHVVFTDGGLKITARMEVVTADGLVQPGLYAAGSNGQGGVLLEGHGHHLGWAFTSGRIAGREAAKPPGQRAQARPQPVSA
jgi:succinate dehydrogenase/fumarate reductase flavoprotein subunit